LTTPAGSGYAAFLMSPSCPACGVALAPASRFCHVCGARVLTAPEVVPPRFTAPANYTPRHLADRILSYRSSLEGEHKSVTVLFCDIAESTALAERIGPEAMFGLLNRFFETSLAEVHRYEGTVNQFLGDGFMAIFGAPLAQEWHARRAVQAALGIRRALRDRQAEITGSTEIEFGVRFGLNTGLVVVGRIGDNLRMDYTAVGDITNVAARLQGRAQPGEILVAQATDERVHGLVDTEPLAPVVLKGKTEPVTIYRVRGLRASRPSGEGSAGRPLSGFVGRDREMTELREALSHAEAGHGQVVGIVSEPGMGKTRLLWEFRHILPDGRVTYLEGQCLPYGATIPYLPILDVLRANCRIAETDAPETVVEKVRAALLAVGMEPATSLPYVLHIFGLKENTGPLAMLSPEAIQSRTFETLRQFCLKGSKRRPIVFAIEDVHWIDRTSEDFMSLMAENLTGMSMLFVATYRPGYAPAWINKSYATQIALRPLLEPNALAVVSSVLATHGASAAAAEEIAARGEGNPLFLEELAHAVVDRGGIPASVPDTLHGVLTARIDRLPDDAKRLLQVASVLGREFSIRLLGAVWDDADSVEAHVRTLTRVEFLYERAWQPDAIYAFKHALTREAAYASLLESRRRLLHARVGQSLEALHAERLDEVTELLAHHFGLSDDGDRAVDYAIRASERAQKRWANTEALAHTDAALRRLDAMPDTEANRVRRIDAVLKQAEVRFALGKHTDQLAALERVRPLIEAGIDPPRRAAWHYWMGFLHSLTGSTPEMAIGYCREASRIAQAAQLEELQAFADSCLAQVWFFAGELEKGLEVGEHALVVFERQGNRWWACRTLAHLSSIANALGDWDRGLAYCGRALDYGRAMDDLRIKVSALIRTASTHIQRGDSEAGLGFCDEAAALGPTQYDGAALRAIRGYGLIKLGRALEGIAEIEQALAWYEKSHLPYTRCQFSLWLVEGCLQEGQSARAQSLAEEAVRISGELGYRRLLGLALRALERSRGHEDVSPPAPGNPPDPPRT
jgi:class 3 adenylate cyclase/tetratricopeptide (TPR) repeat protein